MHTCTTHVYVLVLGACDLYTWGSGTRGMLGHKEEDREKLPRVVESLLGRDITMATCSSSHTLALSSESHVHHIRPCRNVDQQRWEGNVS